MNYTEVNCIIRYIEFNCINILIIYLRMLLTVVQLTKKQQPGFPTTQISLSQSQN